MAERVSFREALRVWGYIGINSFGGPAGQISVMHSELVDKREWLSERRFLHALNYCMLLPGPEAQQLATYIGWLMHGVRGGVAAGALFIIPGFVVMMALSIVYAVFGDVGWISGLLYGLQSAVVAIVAQAVVRVAARTLRTTFLRVIAAVAFLALFVLGAPFPVVVLGAGLIGWAIGRAHPDWLPAGKASQEVDSSKPHLLPDDEAVPPSAARGARRAAMACLVLWLLPVAALLLVLGSDHIFTQQALLFSKSAVVTFGGAYAVLSYISAEAVARYGWITADDMATGLGLAETTPGPLIMVVQFVGFLAAFNNPGNLPPLAAGVVGACIAVWVTFLPCFCFIFAGAPYVERLRGNVAIHHALTGIGAAIVGVIANLAAWFAIATLFDTTRDGPLAIVVPVPSSLNVAAVAIAALALWLTFGLRVSTFRVLGCCALAGVLVSLIGAL